MQSQAQAVRRRKKRAMPTSRTVAVTRGKCGYGFTIAGQHPCVLSCIVSGSPAEQAGLRPGDYLVSVNGENVWRYPHDSVVRMVGLSTGTLDLGIAHAHNSSDSSDEDYPPRSKSRYPNRLRHRQTGPSDPQGSDSRVPYSTSDLHVGPPRPGEAERQGRTAGTWGKDFQRQAGHSGPYPLMSRNSAPCLLSQREPDTVGKGRHGAESEYQYMTMGNPSRAPRLEPLQEDFTFPSRPQVTIGAESTESVQTEGSNPAYSSRREGNMYDFHRGQQREREKENSGDTWNRPSWRQGEHGSKDAAQTLRSSSATAIQQRPALPERPSTSRQHPLHPSRPVSHPNFHSTPNIRRFQDPLSPAAYSRPSAPLDVSLASMMSTFSSYDDGTTQSGQEFSTPNPSREGHASIIPCHEELFSPETLRAAAEAEEEGNGSPVEEDEEEEEDLQPEEDLKAVVGYVGSIELPASASRPAPRLQSLRSAVRRLRIERKVHTMVLMEVNSEGVRLTRPGGMAMAEYPRERISFSGVCPDDKRFFGIVTLHDPADDMSEMSAVAPGENRPGSGSCHIFLVEPDLRAHNAHMGLAATFHLQCPPALPPNPQRCPNFRRSATPIILAVVRLYQNQEPSRLGRDILQSQAFASPAPPAQRSSSSSSNSDSGLGWPRGEDAAPVCVVDVPVSASASAEVSLAQHMSSPAETVHNVTSASISRSLKTGDGEEAAGERSRAGNVSQLSTTPWSSNKYRVLASHQPSQSESSEERWHNKLTPRAMPDPRPRLRRSMSSDGLDLQNSAENLRQSMHRLLQVRQTQQGEEAGGGEGGGCNSDSESQSSSSNRMNTLFADRPVSAPSTQLGKVETVDLLPPRPPARVAWRSPSAPPIPYFPHHDISGDDEDDETDEDDPYIQGIISRLNRDHALGIGADDPRRYSEGFAILRRREKERREAADLQRWTKMGSFRRGRGLKTLCHSHESLAVEGEEVGRLGGATSVHSVAAAVAAGGQGRVESGDANRIAGWAVNFQRLLQDPAGRHVFTEFLKKEFSEENMVFWLACENFKEIEDDEERRSRAVEIFERHLAVRALEPVNVDSYARQAALDQLDQPTPDAFQAAQIQVFQLMKQDSYARFLKSDCYKTFLMREMEGKPLDLPQPAASPSGKGKGKEDKKKKGKENKEEKGKRRSILPWRQKDKKSKSESGGKTESQSKTKVGKEVNNNKKQSGPGIELATNRKETATIREVESVEVEEDARFCRVVLPDGSTTVVCARMGMTARSVLGKLCEKRGISIAAVDVFFTGADKPLDLSEDSGKLGSREVTIERRVLFRMDLPSKKSIGVKAKPNRTVRDVFKPILAKYGHRIDDCNVQISGHSEFLDLESLVSILDNERVIVAPASVSGEEEKPVEEIDLEYLPPATSETGRRGPARRSQRGSLEELTNGIFEALMLGKSHLAHSFDELGTVDLDSGKAHKSRGDLPSLGLFGGRAKREASKGSKKQKARNQVTFALQKNEVKIQPKEHEEFFELLSRVQGQRLEDQRGTWAGPALELPDFLQLHARRRSMERSASASDLFDEVCYMRGNSFHSLQPGHLHVDLFESLDRLHHSSQPQSGLVDVSSHSGPSGRPATVDCADHGASSDSSSSQLVEQSAQTGQQVWCDSSPQLPMQPVVVDLAEMGSREGTQDAEEDGRATVCLEGDTRVPLASPEKFSPRKQSVELEGRLLALRQAGDARIDSSSIGATSGGGLRDVDSANRFAPRSKSTFPTETAAADQSYPHLSGFRRVAQHSGTFGNAAGSDRLTSGHSGDPSIMQAELSVDRLAAGIPARSTPWQQAGRAPKRVSSSQQRRLSQPSKSLPMDLHHDSTGEEFRRPKSKSGKSQEDDQGSVQADQTHPGVAGKKRVALDEGPSPEIVERKGLGSRSGSSCERVLSPSEPTGAFCGGVSRLPERDGSSQEPLVPTCQVSGPEATRHVGTPTGVNDINSVHATYAQNSGQIKDKSSPVELDQQRWSQLDSQTHQRNGATPVATSRQKEPLHKLSSMERKGVVLSECEVTWRHSPLSSKPSGVSVPQTVNDQQPGLFPSSSSPAVPEKGAASAEFERYHRQSPNTPSTFTDPRKGTRFSASGPQQRRISKTPSPGVHERTAPVSGHASQQHPYCSKPEQDGKGTPLTTREQQRHASHASSPGGSDGLPWHVWDRNQTPQPQAHQCHTNSDSPTARPPTYSQSGPGEVNGASQGAQDRAYFENGATPTTHRNAFVSYSGPLHLQSSSVDLGSLDYSKQSLGAGAVYSHDSYYPSHGAHGRDAQGVETFRPAHHSVLTPETRHTQQTLMNDASSPYPSLPSGMSVESTFQTGTRNFGSSSGFVEETVTFV